MKPKNETWFSKNEIQNFLKSKPEIRFSKSEPENKIQTFAKPKNKNRFSVFDIWFSNKTKSENEIHNFLEPKMKNRFSKNKIRNRYYFQKRIGDFQNLKFQNRFWKWCWTKQFLKYKKKKKNGTWFWKQPKSILFLKANLPQINDSKNSKIDLNIYGRSPRTREASPGPSSSHQLSGTGNRDLTPEP